MKFKYKLKTKTGSHQRHASALSLQL